MVERLMADDRKDVVDVLVTSFRDYPVMRFVLADHSTDYTLGLRALIGYYCDKRLVNDWPVLGMRVDGRIAAVALVSEPVASRASAVRALETDLKTTLGNAAFDRMVAYESVSDGNEPTDSHHYVGMLGVAPEHQGQGFGKALLDRVKRLSVEQGSAGVCLSTEDPANVDLYHHLGFETLAEADIEWLHTWSLRWPNPDYAPVD